jgi:hypothetical protein
VQTERSGVEELFGDWEEDPVELSALFDELYAACEPADPVERGLLEMSCIDLTQARRSRHFVELIEEALIVDTKNLWWDWQENGVKVSTAKLASEPATALAELKGFSSGYLWLIGCWEELESLVQRETAASDADRDKSVARKVRDSSRLRLSHAETERLTRVYGMLAQNEPTEREILAFYVDTSLLPKGSDYQCATPLPSRRECRRRVRAVIERELPPMRSFVGKAQSEVEDRAIAEAIEKLIARDKARTYLLESKARSEKSFRETYNCCKKNQTRRKGFARAFPLLAAELEAMRPKKRVDRGAP